MKKLYKVKVNNSSEFNFNPDQLNKLNVVQATKPIYHILDKNKSMVAEVIHKDFDSKSYTIRINSNNYTVKIENQLDQLIKELGFSVGSSKKLNDIKAPMPGIIIGIEIKTGDQIKEGDTLLILEAMKMENAIICPKDATIKSVLVKTGDTVEKNKLLIELE